MLIAQNDIGEWVLAENGQIGSKYYCPKCKEQMSLVKNSVHFIDHFRHRNDSSCSLGAAETAAHYMKKHNIAMDLESALGKDNVRVEYTLADGQQPDVYFEVEGKGVAVEVQHSHIDDEELADRIASYSNKNVASIWMPDGVKRLLNTAVVNERTGLAEIPLWMRRIAKMTDDVAFDHYADAGRHGGELVSLSLKLKTRTIKNAKGEWVTDEYWPTRGCILSKGSTRVDVASNGYKRMLWIPSPTQGESLVSMQGKRELRRRDIAEAVGANVECLRAPSDLRGETTFETAWDAIRERVLGSKLEPVAFPVSQNEFQSAMRKFWEDRKDISFHEKMAMMGYK